MKLLSEKVEIGASSNKVLDFIEIPSNIKFLLPIDKISDFKSDENSCSFKVQGGITISLVNNGRDGDNKLFLKSGEKSPFPFELTIYTESIDCKSIGYIEFNGELNSFLIMMVEKPLSALFNYMSKKLSEQFS